MFENVSMPKIRFGFSTIQFQCVKLFSIPDPKACIRSATEATTRTPISMEDLPNEIVQALLENDITIEDVRDHIWKYHSGPNCERDQEVAFQSYYKTDDIAEVANLINSVKNMYASDIAMWIFNHINEEDIGVGYAMRHNFGAIPKSKGVVGYVDDVKYGLAGGKHTSEECKALQMAFALERHHDEYNFYLVNAYPIKNMNYANTDDVRVKSMGKKDKKKKKR